MKQTQHKLWLSPLTAVLFLAVSLSGILMFFHLKVPGMHGMHEWGGMLFLLVATAHLFLNWNILSAYLRNKKAVFAAGAGLLMVILLLLVVPDKGEHNAGPGGRDIQGHAYRHSPRWTR